MVLLRGDISGGGSDLNPKPQETTPYMILHLENTKTSVSIVTDDTKLIDCKIRVLYHQDPVPKTSSWLVLLWGECLGNVSCIKLPWSCPARPPLLVHLALYGEFSYFFLNFHTLRKFLLNSMTSTSRTSLSCLTSIISWPASAVWHFG